MQVLRPGSIIIVHANRTKPGPALELPQPFARMVARGATFIRLSEAPQV